jgi:dipeptidyl aminopeptidase/acylaminoacyl peptidase
LNARVNRRVFPILVLLQVAAGAAPARAADPIPLRDFFRNPERDAFKISPDGKTLSFLGPYRGHRNLFVQPVAGGAPTRLTSEAGRDIVEYFWKGNDRLLYFRDLAGEENFHLFSVGRAGGRARDLTPFPAARVAPIDPRLDDDRAVLIGLNRRDPGAFDAYRLEVATGKLTLLAQNPGTVTSWLADHAGNVRVAVASDGVHSKLLYRDGGRGPFRTLLSTDFRERLQPLLFTFDDRKLYVTSNLQRDLAALTIFDPATAREERVVFAHPEVDVQNVEVSERRKRLTAASYQTWRDERRFLDPESEAFRRRIADKLPGYEIDPAAHSQDETIVVVLASNDRSQGGYYLYDGAADKLTKLADLAPWLPEARMAPVKPLTFKARDGLTLHGYLTVPPAAPAPLPTVVIVHGGPWDQRETWGWNPEVQWLASRGYAVLQVNYRGSSSYGRKFWEASFKQWGRAMQDDISDGVRHLIAQRLADPRRICIFGGSWGGYATLAGLAFTPELYACGVEYSGMSNLVTWMNAAPAYDLPFREMLHAMIGDPVKDRALLEAVSPALHADQIRAPLFVAQGKNDPRVKIAESDQMVAALRKRGVEVRYLVKADEGHGFASEENRLDFYGAMEDFLAAHLR